MIYYASAYFLFGLYVILRYAKTMEDKGEDLYLYLYLFLPINAHLMLTLYMFFDINTMLIVILPIWSISLFLYNKNKKNKDLIIDRNINWRKYIFKDSGIIGDIRVFNDCWEYQKSNTCAINTQRLILSKFGISRDEEHLKHIQKSFGEYNKISGSSSLVRLLDSYKIKYRTISTVNIDSPYDKDTEYIKKKLAEEIITGSVLIAKTNSYLLNLNDDDLEVMERPSIDHSIIITALEKINDCDLFVYYTDTGIPNGAIRKTNLDKLIKISSSEYISVNIKTKSIPQKTISTETKDSHNQQPMDDISKSTNGNKSFFIITIHNGSHTIVQGKLSTIIRFNHRIGEAIDKYKINSASIYGVLNKENTSLPLGQRVSLKFRGDALKSEKFQQVIRNIWMTF
jgi:hypothetical protein